MQWGMSLYIKTSCNAACNLSSGEKIAEQGADRVREQSHDKQLEQERLAIERQRVEAVTAVEQPQKVSDQTINHRVNEYQSQDN
ncbi:hypothetical protein ACMAZF_07130 [Psychrobium sp. nBUS_13]|uniref:hypothetical protein n=1 Tax=Psychrobium sp. nBUS_13 TaxID=3395319 RepID=UPI003EBD660B